MEKAVYTRISPVNVFRCCGEVGDSVVGFGAGIVFKKCDSLEPEICECIFMGGPSAIRFQMAGIKEILLFSKYTYVSAISAEKFIPEISTNL